MEFLAELREEREPAVLWVVTLALSDCLLYRGDARLRYEENMMVLLPVGTWVGRREPGYEWTRLVRLMLDLLLRLLFKLHSYSK